MSQPTPAPVSPPLGFEALPNKPPPSVGCGLTLPHLQIIPSPLTLVDRGQRTTLTWANKKSLFIMAELVFRQDLSSLKAVCCPLRFCNVDDGI